MMEADEPEKKEAKPEKVFKSVFDGEEFFVPKERSFEWYGSGEAEVTKMRRVLRSNYRNYNSFFKKVMKPAKKAAAVNRHSG